MKVLSWTLTMLWGNTHSVQICFALFSIMTFQSSCRTKPLHLQSMRCIMRNHPLVFLSSLGNKPWGLALQCHWEHFKTSYKLRKWATNSIQTQQLSQQNKVPSLAVSMVSILMNKKGALCKTSLNFTKVMQQNLLCLPMGTFQDQWVSMTQMKMTEYLHVEKNSRCNQANSCAWLPKTNISRTLQHCLARGRQRVRGRRHTLSPPHSAAEPWSTPVM